MKNRERDGEANSAQSDTSDLDDMPEGFLKETAEVMGVSEETVRQLAVIGGAATEEVLLALNEGIISTPEAAQIARLTRDQQCERIRRLRNPSADDEIEIAQEKMEMCAANLEKEFAEVRRFCSEHRVTLSKEQRIDLERKLAFVGAGWEDAFQALDLGISIEDILKAVDRTELEQDGAR